MQPKPPMAAWKAATTLLILSGLVLSGCLGKKEATSLQNLQPTVSADTGAIAGLVLGPEGLPLEAADVLIRGNDKEATLQTDAAGRFTAGQLQPGTYLVLTSKLGYTTAQKHVEVKAGEVAEATFTVLELGIQGLGHHAVLGPLKGRFFCGWGTGVFDSAGPCMLVSVGLVDPIWQDVTGGDANIFELREAIKEKQSGPEDKLSGLVVEVNWQPTSAGSRWLQATLEEPPEEPGARSGDPVVWARAKGPNPIKMVATPGTKNVGGEKEMPAEAAGFLVGVFPSVDPDSPRVNNNVNTGLSAYVDQSFELWITLFYNQPAPAEYSVLNV